MSSNKSKAMKVIGVCIILASVQLGFKVFDKQDKIKKEEASKVESKIQYTDEKSNKSDVTLNNVDIKKPFFDKMGLHNEWGLNLNNKYSKMTGALSIDNSSNIKVAHLDIYGDDKFIKSYTLNAGCKPIDINEDVKNINKFSIVSDLSITSDLNEDGVMKLEMAFKDSNVKFGSLTIK